MNNNIILYCLSKLMDIHDVFSNMSKSLNVNNRVGSSDLNHVVFPIYDRGCDSFIVGLRVMDNNECRIRFENFVTMLELRK